MSMQSTTSATLAGRPNVAALSQSREAASEAQARRDPVGPRFELPVLERTSDGPDVTRERTQPRQDADRVDRRSESSRDRQDTRESDNIRDTDDTQRAEDAERAEEARRERQDRALDPPVAWLIAHTAAAAKRAAQQAAGTGQPLHLKNRRGAQGLSISQGESAALAELQGDGALFTASELAPSGAPVVAASSGQPLPADLAGETAALTGKPPAGIPSAGAVSDEMEDALATKAEASSAGPKVAEATGKPTSGGGAASRPGGALADGLSTAMRRLTQQAPHAATPPQSSKGPLAASSAAGQAGALGSAASVAKAGVVAGSAVAGAGGLSIQSLAATQLSMMGAKTAAPGSGAVADTGDTGEGGETVDGVAGFEVEALVAKGSTSLNRVAGQQVTAATSAQAISEQVADAVRAMRVEEMMSEGHTGRGRVLLEVNGQEVAATLILEGRDLLVRMNVEDPATRALVDEGLQRARDALVDEGLVSGRVDVGVGGGGGGRGGRAPGEGPQDALASRSGMGVAENRVATPSRAAAVGAHHGVLNLMA